MLKNRICYLLIILLLLLFRIAYTGYVSGMLLLMTLVLPLFSWLISLLGALSTTIRVQAPDELIRGVQAEINLKLIQSPLFITGPVRGKIQMINDTTGQVQTVTVQSNRVGVSIHTEHCCQMTCTLQKVRVYDLLGLFPLPVKKPAPIQITIHPIPSEPPEHPDWNSGSSLVSKPFSGSSTPYDLREYRTGDTMRSIHWKKSAALDKTIVRDSLEPAVRIANICLDWPESDSARDYILDQLAWCIIYLKQNNAGINVKWLSADGNEQYIYETVGQLDQVISEMLTQRPGRIYHGISSKRSEILLSAPGDGGIQYD